MRKITTLIALALVWAATAPAQELVPTGPRDFCPVTDPGLTIEFEMPGPAVASLTINDPFSGHLIRTLLDDSAIVAGRHQVIWDGRDLTGEMLDVQPFEIRLYVEAELVDDDWGSIQCGNDLGTPVREMVGAHDVSLGFYASLANAEDVEWAIYDAAGTTLVAPLYSGQGSNVIGIIFVPASAPGAPLPAGDYLCRLTSSTYSEDLPFFMDPVVPVGTTVSILDGDDNLVAGVDPLLGRAQVYGPLQEAWFEFDRVLSAPEFEYLLGEGLRFYGNFDQAGPGPMTVASDSMSIHIESFDPVRPWNELLGDAFVFNQGMLVPSGAAFRFGYHQTGVTSMSETCASLGVTDPADWQFSESFNVEAPCPNPVAPGNSTRFGFGLMQDAYCFVRIHDESGQQVRTLVEGWLNGGYHTVVWDLLDDAGLQVPDGLYHLAWHAPDPETDEMIIVTSGEIQVYSAVPVGDEAPFARALPRLESNHPNPFNPRTTIAFDLPRTAPVSLRIFDISGALITTLIDGEVHGEGRHEVIWAGRDDLGRSVASGTYFYRLETGGFGETKSMVLLK